MTAERQLLGSQPVKAHVERQSHEPPPMAGYYRFQCGHERALQKVKVLGTTEIAWGYFAETKGETFRVLFTNGFPFDHENQEFEAVLHCVKSLGEAIRDLDVDLTYDAVELVTPTPRDLIERLAEEEIV